MLKVMDGARTLDGANAVCDIPIANYANGNTMNGAGVDMSGHLELLANLQTGVVTGTATVTLVVQESNDNTTFANVSGASVTVVNNANSNQSKWISVNWAHPDRKRYARVQGLVTVANAAFYSASTLRVRSKNRVDADSSIAAA